MVALSTCPDPDRLRLYLHARLEEGDVAILEEHLSGCDRCADSLDDLTSFDVIAMAIREHAAADAGPEADEVTALIERLRQNPPQEIGSNTGSGITVERGDLGEEPKAAEEVLDFLAPAQSADELGRLGPYRVLGLIGSGGMGIVFRAEDPHLERVVALKAMKRSLAASDADRRRFLREARTIAAIEHDHVVVIHQAGEDRGVLYLAMPLLKGESLEDRLKRERRLPLAEALRTAREAALGLSAVHARDLVHRDVKPANIWLEAGQGRVKLLDFGLAREIDDAASLTDSGTIAGTPHYMSPEQTRGATVTHRSDLFSLGSVLYRMLTGRPPFRGADRIAVMLAVADKTPLPPNQIDPTLPRSVSDLTLRLLAKAPEGRPASAQAVAQAIAAIEHGLAAPVPPPRRRFGAIAAAAAALLFLFSAIVIMIKTNEGTLVLSVNEPDVTVVVDGELKKTTITSPRDAIEVSLVPGRHLLKVSKDGFETVTREFRIVRGGKEELTARLEPLVDANDSKVSASVVSPSVRPPLATPLAANSSPVVATTADASGLYDEEFPGLVPRPATLPGIHRWQIGSRFSRGELLDFAWSPDGAQIAAGGLDEMVRVHDARTMRLLRAWPARRPFSVDWSKDGRWIATGASDSKVRLWHAGSGAAGPILYGHTGRIDATAFSPDSHWLATCDTNRTVRVWNVSDGSEQWTLRQPASVLDVAWNPDGETVATAGGDGLIRICDAASGQIVQTLKGHDGAVRAVSFSADGTRFASAGADKKFRIWTVKRGAKGRSWEEGAQSIAVNEDVEAVTLNRDGSMAAVVLSRRPNPLTLWRAVDGVWKLQSSLIGQWVHGSHRSARFRPDGEQVATANLAGTLSVWDVKTGKDVQLLERHSPIYHAAACDAAGESIACSGAFSDTAWLWRVADGTLRRVLRAPAAANGSIGGIALSTDGKEVAAGFVDRLWGPHVAHSVGIWNLAENGPARLLEGAALTPNVTVAFSPDARKVAAGSWDQLRVWDTASGHSLFKLDGATTGLAFAPDGRKIVAVGWQKIRFVDLETGSVGPVVATPAGETATSVIFHDNGRTIITTESTGIRIRDGATGKVIRELPLVEAVSVAISPDGTLLAASSWRGDMRIWEFSTGVQRWDLWQNAPARGLCFIPHSHLLASGGGDGTLRFWDMRTGAQVRVMLALSGNRAAVITPAGDLKANDPSAEDELVYLVQEKKDGPVQNLTPREFRARWDKDAAPPARKASGTGRPTVGR